MLALSVKKDDIILAIPSDHIIKDIPLYLDAIKIANSTAKNGYISLFGIKPISPHIGYGYICDANNKIMFFEKPSIEDAKKYVKKDNYYWNSGMFCFKASTPIDEFNKYEPEMLIECKKIIKEATHSGDFIKIKQMDGLKNISIDYAIMEKSERLKLIESKFYWNDVGNFDALKNEYPTDSNNNATNTNLIALDSKNNFILADKLVATIGIEDLTIIDSDDSLLITKNGKGEMVRDIVKNLQKTNHSLYQSNRKVYRPWGMYSVLLESKNYKIKQIIVKPNKRLSLQKHFHRNEHWTVVSGSATITIEDKDFILRANESTYIPMGSKHRLYNPGKIDLIIVEVQVGEYLGEDDIVRIEDDYDRK